MKKPLIHITPNKIMLDEKVHIRLTGFEPDQLITLRAKIAKGSWRD